MAADIASALDSWSTVASSNSPSGSTVIGTNLDDNLREIQAVVRQLAASNTLAAAATTDLSSVKETFVTLTGAAVTITSFGTLSAGMYKWIVFNAAHTLTHNGTSLILPTSANITTASGDVAMFVSLGSGNWRCTSYLKADGSSFTVSPISGLQAATATNTINNGDYKQNWQWKLTTASNVGLNIEESATSTASTDPVLFKVNTKSGSTAWPFMAGANDKNNISVDETGSVSLSSTAGRNLVIGRDQSLTAVSLSSGNSGGIKIYGQDNYGAGYTAGGISINGGMHTSSGSAGSVSISGGLGGDGGDVDINGGLGEDGKSSGSINLVTSGLGYGTVGSISITTGSISYTTTSSNAGGITLTAGNTAGNGAGGSITLTAGNTGSGGTAGSINLVAGGSAYSSSTLGNVNLTAPGKVLIRAPRVAFASDNNPTISSGGGTGATITGSNSAFQVTFGIGSPTSVTVAFGDAFTTAPIVVATGTQSGQVVHVGTVSTTQVQISSNTAFSSGTKVNVICIEPVE